MQSGESEEEDLRLDFRAIRPGDKIGAGFSLGDEAFRALKTFIKRDAHSYELNSLARTYAFFQPDSNLIQAYITITCGQIAVKGVNTQHSGSFRLPHDYPAMKIARLAVAVNLRGHAIGRKLVEIALGIAKDVICPSIGCRFAVVDAKPQSIGFYERCGFTLLDTPQNHKSEFPIMFLDLAKV